MKQPRDNYKHQAVLFIRNVMNTTNDRKSINNSNILIRADAKMSICEYRNASYLLMVLQSPYADYVERIFDFKHFKNNHYLTTGL